MEYLFKLIYIYCDMRCSFCFIFSFFFFFANFRQIHIYLTIETERQTINLVIYWQTDFTEWKKVTHTHTCGLPTPVETKHISYMQSYISLAKLCSPNALQYLATWHLYVVCVTVFTILHLCLLCCLLFALP